MDGRYVLVQGVAHYRVAQNNICKSHTPSI
jgi:hypothetical protein